MKQVLLQLVNYGETGFIELAAGRRKQRVCVIEVLDKKNLEST